MRKILFLLFFVSSVVGRAAEMADTAAMLDEVVVTGSNAALPPRLLPYTVSVITRDRLDATGSTQLLSAISGQVPSLFVTERGIFGFGVSNGGSGHIKMRGIGGDRASAVLMMLDGQPQFAGIYSHHVADFYDKDYAERVEVLRGPSSVLYGSNAMAGTINVITRKVHHDGVHATLTSQYGSYNTWLSTLTTTMRYGRLSALLSASYDRTDGSIDGMDFKQGGGYAKLAYEFSDYWRAYADYAVSNFRGNDPVWPTLSDPASTDVYRQNVTRGEASAAVTNSYGVTDGTARVYYSYGNHYIDDPRHFHSVDDRFGVMIYQNFRPWQGAAATVGFDFNTYTGKIPVSGGSTGNMGTMTRKSVPEASAAMGYRNPSFRELYLYRMANPDLAPERMWNYEVSLSRSFGTWGRAELTAYYSKGDNLIQVVDNHNENTGRFINKGIEASASARVTTGLSLSASYSYLHTSLSDLTGAPRHQYYIGADWKALSWLHVYADVKGVGHLFVHQSYKPQSYALLNFRFDFDVVRYLTLFVRLDNVTGAAYTINRGYRMPGFTAMGGFRLKI